MAKRKPRIVLTIVTKESSWEFSSITGRALAKGGVSAGPTPKQFEIAYKAIAALLESK